MKVSFPHTDLLIEHLAQGTKVSSILFDQNIGNLGRPPKETEPESFRPLNDHGLSLYVATGLAIQHSCH